MVPKMALSCDRAVKEISSLITVGSVYNCFLLFISGWQLFSPKRVLAEWNDVDKDLLIWGTFSAQAILKAS